MKAGDKIKWTAKDNDGVDFTEVGTIKKITDTRVVFKTKHGMCEVALCDGTFEIVQDGDESSLDTLEQVADAEVEAGIPSPPPAPKQGSKLERAILLLKANPKATRKEAIELFMKELEMSPAGASTYVHNARKAIEKGA